MKKTIFFGLSFGLVVILTLAGFLYYIYQDEKKNLKLNVTKSTMVELITHIELYKAKNKIYPESLNSLLEQIPPEIQGIHVSTLIGVARAMKKININYLEEEYYYERVNQRYYLFGLGKDQKPFSKDDIHIKENSNYGLINKESK